MNKARRRGNELTLGRSFPNNFQTSLQQPSTTMDIDMNFAKQIRNALLGLIPISLIWIIPSILFTIPNYSSFENSSQLKAIYIGFIFFFIFILSNMMARYFVFERGILGKDLRSRGVVLILVIIIRLILFEMERIDTFIGTMAGILGTADLIILSYLLGSYLPEAIKRVPELVPVCSVALFIDLFSVLQGPSKKIANLIQEHYIDGTKETTPFIDILFIKIPTPYTDYLMPIFGISDLIFATFISAVMLKFNINDNMIGKNMNEFIRTPKNCFFYFPVVMFSLLSAILIASWLNIFLPALPVIVMITLPWIAITNIKLFKFKRNDWLLTAIPPVVTLILYLFL